MQNDAFKKEATTPPPSSAYPRRSRPSFHLADRWKLDAVKTPQQGKLRKSATIVDTSRCHVRLSSKTSKTQTTRLTVAAKVRGRAMEKAVGILDVGKEELLQAMLGRTPIDDRAHTSRGSKEGGHAAKSSTFGGLTVQRRLANAAAATRRHRMPEPKGFWHQHSQH